MEEPPDIIPCYLVEVERVYSTLFIGDKNTAEKLYSKAYEKGYLLLV